MDPNIWGPHYWFTLHSIASTFPEHPNETIRKKYYDFIHNLPLFLPNRDIGNLFLELLDKYPVGPYLQNRLSFMKWFHFIHNKINSKSDKPEISFHESLESYYNHYKPEEIVNMEWMIQKKKIIQITTLISIFFLIIYIYNK
jgi:hypothetical protein